MLVVAAANSYWLMLTSLL